MELTFRFPVLQFVATQGISMRVGRCNRGESDNGDRKERN